MKWIRWLLPLLFLFMFAMPLVGADNGPPGDLVIEQTTEDPQTPVPALEAQESLLTPLLAGISGSPLIGTGQSPQPPGAAAQAIYANMQARPPALQLLRSTSDTVQPAALRLWSKEGGVAFCRCMEAVGLPRA